MISKYKKAKSVKFPQAKIIKIENIEKYDLEMFNHDFQKLENDYSIYVITSSEFKMNHDQVKDTFQNLKDKSKTYHVSKINEEVFWKPVNDEFIIYVGSKEHNIKKRMKEHLGLNNNRSTYSLFLKDWWPTNTVITVKIWSMEKLLKHDDKYEMLQILEDLIWEEYKPIFGKKGATFNKKQKALK